MDIGSRTANFVAGQLVACYWSSYADEQACKRYNADDKSWTKIADTSVRRHFHSSAQHEDRILLIGGEESNSTEWIPTRGGDTQIGPWIVRHGSGHCTIQVSSDLIVVTGGYNTYDY